MAQRILIKVKILILKYQRRQLECVPSLSSRNSSISFTNLILLYIYSRRLWFNKDLINTKLTNREKKNKKNKKNTYAFLKELIQLKVIREYIIGKV